MKPRQHCRYRPVALQAIRDRGRLQGGQALLVNGAAGGIGSLAVQLGKALGAVVTGVCSGDSSELVASLGADEVIDFEKEDLATLTGTFDVVLSDTSGQLTPDRRRKMPRAQRALYSDCSVFAHAARQRDESFFWRSADCPAAARPAATRRSGAFGRACRSKQAASDHRSGVSTR
ncbi:MAG: zinc-binding dehydrogenase [Polyangia bacterium]